LILTRKRNEENGTTKWIGCRKSPRTQEFFNFESLSEKATGNRSDYCFPEDHYKEKPKAKRSSISEQPFDGRDRITFSKVTANVRRTLKHKEEPNTNLEFGPSVISIPGKSHGLMDTLLDDQSQYTLTSVRQICERTNSFSINRNRADYQGT